MKKFVMISLESAEATTIDKLHRACTGETVMIKILLTLRAACR